MLTLTVNISDLDCDALADLFLPQVIQELSATNPTLGRLLSGGGTLAANAVKGLISRMSQEKKESLVADVINRNSQQVCRKLQELAQHEGVHLHLSDAQAQAHK